MGAYVPSLALLPRVEAGEPAAIGRLISRAESGVPEARETLASIYRRAGRAHVVGLTGVPGSGKSTLVALLAQKLRDRGMKVGIVAVDPSSPYSGGSILGDRIRMSDLALDPGVYIRSMATRGAMGGMARAALDAVDILDVAGFDTVIIETVGVGQDEVEIARASHTTVVVSAPGLGDEIQAIKAGILEIADIHTVSKCDRSDASRTLTDIKAMLTLGTAGTVRPEWVTPVIGVSSITGQGIDELIDTLAEHRNVAFGTEFGRSRQLAIARFRLQKTAENLLLESFDRASAAEGPELALRLQRREGDPYTLAKALVVSSLRREYGDELAAERAA
jgi:LAO/AO transport system kinase